MRKFLRNYNSVLLLVFLLCLSFNAVSQHRISGTVTSQEEDMPLPGVTIQIKGSSTGVVTDMDGKYSISVPNNEAVLVFSFVGYVTEELAVSNRAVIDVVMYNDIKALEEIVVVGYGTQKKRDVTGAIASFKGDVLETMPQTNIAQALQGRVAGLNVTMNSADAEGNNMDFLVRGRNSFSANSGPFIVVDGVPYEGNLSEINPNDIASIEVLKDASSAAIYGARSANGVILITTKRGTKGKVKVSYDTFYGMDEIAHLPDMMNGKTFYEAKLGRFGALTPTEMHSYENGLDTDWIDLATRTGTRQQHNLSLSGGTDHTRYFISGTYLDAKGIAKNDDFKRFTLRLNFDTKVNDYISFGTNTQLGHYDRSAVSANFTNAFNMNPLVPAYEEDGRTLRIFPWEEDPFYSNPLEGFNVLQEDLTRSVISNNYINVEIPYIKGLSYRMNTGYNYRTRAIERYFGANTRNGLQQGGRSELRHWQNENWLVENILNYSREFGEHTINFTGLYSAQQRYSKNHDLNANGFPSDIMTNYQGNLATAWVPNDEYVQWNYISQMARLNYSFKGRYLLTATARRDGYSGFGSNTKYGIFPSIATGWNIDQESFMTDIRAISALKIRASYGLNGNQAISPYQTLPGLANEHYLNNNRETAFGFYPQSLGDPTLGWESTKAANFGIDFGFVNNRVQGSIDYFRSNTYDLLVWKQVSLVNGINRILTNIGETKNRGIDLQVSSINVKKRDFEWVTDLNVSHYRNSVVDVGLRDENGNLQDDVANRWFIGQPINVNFSYIMDGIWQEGEDIVNSHQPTARPGEIKVRDVSGDGKIDADDRDFIGSAIPLFTAGINNTFSYKNWSLGFFINTVQGLTRSNDLMNPFFDGRTRTMNRNFWTPENPHNEFPANRDDANPHQVQFFGSANNASFVRLNDITLRYRLGKSITDQLQVGRAEAYVNVKNAATFTSWQGLDPELSNQRGIPMARSIILGFRIEF